MFKFFRNVGILILGLVGFVSTQSVFAMAPEPEVIYGTWQTGDKTRECVVCALESGIRYIDTARMYGNEKQVGLAVNEFISKSGTCRESIKIITKRRKVSTT